ncbi:MAG: hypothetical protein AAF950_17440 [Pseudomonadota bacterium]
MGWPIDVLTPVISPKLVERIELAAITEMMDHLTMRPATLLAMTISTIKSHRRAKLGPVDRIEIPVDRLDRHQSHILDANSASSMPQRPLPSPWPCRRGLYFRGKVDAEIDYLKARILPFKWRLCWLPDKRVKHAIVFWPLHH